jgi:hypothetical protein
VVLVEHRPGQVDQCPTAGVELEHRDIDAVEVTVVASRAPDVDRPPTAPDRRAVGRGVT